MQESIEKRLHCFGCPCHLVIGAAGDDAEELLILACAELERLESRFCSFVPGSLISSINRAAGSSQYIALDAEARSLFHYVTALWQNSARMFDPSGYMLQQYYSGNVPPAEAASLVESRLPLVDWSRLEITDAGARLSEPGMAIDLNSCIRPYVVDSVRKVLLRHGASSALVDLDRDIATIGRQTDGSNWMAGMRYPRGTSTAIARIKLNDGAYAIRGDFERCLLLGGERFSRAISPIDGLPVPGLLSVAVMADTCLEACSAASIARLKTEEAALQWLEKLGQRWMAIDRKLRTHGPLAPATIDS